MQADRTSELRSENRDLSLGGLGKRDPSRRLGGVQLRAQLLESPAIGRLRPVVEQLARVVRRRDVEPRRVEIRIDAAGIVVLAGSGETADEVERMELDRGMAQEVGEVGESLRVLEPNGAIPPPDGPVLALLAEHPLRGFRRRAIHCGPSLAPEGSILPADSRRRQSRSILAGSRKTRSVS